MRESCASRCTRNRSSRCDTDTKCVASVRSAKLELSWLINDNTCDSKIFCFASTEEALVGLATGWDSTVCKSGTELAFLRVRRDKWLEEPSPFDWLEGGPRASLIGVCCIARCASKHS